MKSHSGLALHLSLLLTAGWFAIASPVFSGDVYGPVDLVKTMSTPFGSGSRTAGVAAEGASGRAAEARPRSEDSTAGRMLLPITPVMRQSGSSSPPQRIVRHSESQAPGPVESISIGSSAPSLAHRSLSDRLVQARLYLPGRLVLGRTAEFTVKGRPGYFVALAMADKDSGARPIFGHTIRLGADRKLVCVGQIPEDGVLHLVIETPIQGDLIGQPLFFEAALWSRPDFTDLEIASPVTSEGEAGVKNGVLVAGEPEQKKGIKFVPQSTPPSEQLSGPTYPMGSAGRP